MKVLSVQSVAGGTGVTAFALELAGAARAQGQRVLLIDTEWEPVLSERVSRTDYPWLLNYPALFEDLDRTKTNQPWIIASDAIICMPSRPHLRAGKIYPRRHEHCVEEAPLAPLNLRRNLEWLAPQFDIAIVDVENGDLAKMAMFSEISDEIHLIERRIPEAGIERWKDLVEDRMPTPLRATIIRHEDMQDSFMRRGELEFETVTRLRQAAEALQGIQQPINDEPPEFAETDICETV